MWTVCLKIIVKTHLALHMILGSIHFFVLAGSLEQTDPGSIDVHVIYIRIPLCLNRLVTTRAFLHIILQCMRCCFIRYFKTHIALCMFVRCMKNFINMLSTYIRTYIAYFSIVTLSPALSVKLPGDKTQLSSNHITTACSDHRLRQNA